MATGFLGTGWSFPLGVDGGALRTRSDEEKVSESIRIILGTAPGERVMRPDFGCGIHDLVFENLGDGMVGRVANAVTEALARWEPRIDVLGVEVLPDSGEPTRLDIRVAYAIRATNSRFNLVYPFYVS